MSKLEADLFKVRPTQIVDSGVAGALVTIFGGVAGAGKGVLGVRILKGVCPSRDIKSRHKCKRTHTHMYISIHVYIYICPLAYVGT